MRSLLRSLALALPIVATACALMAPAANATAVANPNTATSTQANTTKEAAGFKWGLSKMFMLPGMRDGAPPWPYVQYKAPGDDYRYEFKTKLQNKWGKIQTVQDAARAGYVPILLGFPGHPSLHMVNPAYLFDFRAYDVNRPEYLVFYQDNPIAKPEGMVGVMFQRWIWDVPVAKWPGSTDLLNTPFYYHVTFMCDLRQAYMLHPNWMIHKPQNEADCKPPVKCPDGSMPKPDGSCTPTCPNGQMPKPDGTCAPTCPNGQMPKPDGSCYTPCPDGTMPKPDGSCTPPPVSCPDGSMPQSDGTCPKPPVSCPDGSKAPVSGKCPTGTTTTSPSTPAQTTTTTTTPAPAPAATPAPAKPAPAPAPAKPKKTGLFGWW